MPAEPRVLVVWGQYPRWVPPCVFAKDQIIITAKKKFPDEYFKDQGPHAFNYFPEFQPTDWIECGEFDLAEWCERKGVGTKFDWILVFAEQDTGTFARNLKAFDCPKALLVGDTHHFAHPITMLVDYAKSEGIDTIIAQFTAHHLHWFQKAGFPHLGWYPGLSNQQVVGEMPPRRDPVVRFVGHTWGYHGRRAELLSIMQGRNVPLVISTETRAGAAQAYARSVISWNCSLNSDINIRNFEITSSGGFMLTDALHEATGHPQLFPRGVSCDTYASVDELFSKIDYYLAHPDAAEKIARSALARFNEQQTREKFMERFRADIFFSSNRNLALPRDRRIHEASNHDWRRRLAFYEAAQELHRTQSSVEIFVEPNAAWFEAEDLCDLPRVRLHSSADRPGFIKADRSARTWDFVADV